MLRLLLCDYFMFISCWINSFDSFLSLDFNVMFALWPMRRVGSAVVHVGVKGKLAPTIKS